MANIKQVLGQAFDSGAVEPQQAFDVLPPGTYTVEISETELQETKSGTGTMLKVVHTVIDPAAFATRKLWKRINIRNQSQQAEQIGQAELSALCRAAGIGVLNDSDELVGKIVRCKVTVKPADGQYPEQNEVKAYESANASAPKTAAPAKPPAPAKPAPPWAKAKAA